MSKRRLSPKKRGTDKKVKHEITEILSYAVMNSPATVVITDADGMIEYVNLKFSELTGYAPSEAIGQKASLLKSGLMAKASYRALWRHLKMGKSWDGEFYNRKKNGDLYWEQASISPVRDTAGVLRHYLKIAEDVTERKRLEADLLASIEALKTQKAQAQSACRELAATTRELKKSQCKLQRLSQEDGLTGLLNRRGFDSELQRVKALAERQGHSIGILIIDIDNFKQINDQRGHATGDHILKACAKLFRSRLRASDLICRYGGDEIVIALPSANTQTTRQTAQRLLAAVRQHDFSKGRSALSITVSIGGACGMPAPGQPFEGVIKLADHALYHVKRNGRDGFALDTPDDDPTAETRLPAKDNPTTRRQPKGELITTLLALLEARDYATAAHCRRVCRMATSLARALKLPSDQVARIAQSALLHDIGKIAIPDAILLKPSALTAAERTIIQTHSQIGHELLQNRSDLKAVAEIVCAHHERLDGSGYPFGLKDPQIGMEARILAVADTYDTIRIGRIYAQPRSETDALRELQRCRGTQFDPAVVDALTRCQDDLEAAVNASVSAKSPPTSAGRNNAVGRRDTSRP